MLVLAVITAQQTGSTTEPIQNARRRHCAASRSLNTPTRIGGSNGGFQNTTGLQGARGVVTNWYDYVCRGGTGLLLEQACTQSSNGIVAYGQNFRILSVQAMAVVDLLVKQGMKPSSRVLDIGCGWGRMAAYIVPFLDPTAGGRYSGFDQDCGEIKKAKQTLRKCGDGMDASFTCTHSKVENRYPFANQSFDLAFAYGAIAFEAQSWTAKRLPISILLEHLQEISRTLSPRGVAMISIYLVDEAVAKRMDSGLPIDAWYLQKKRLFPHKESRLCPGSSIDCLPVWMSERGDTGWSRPLLTSLAQSVGLKVRTIVRGGWSLALEVVGDIDYFDDFLVLEKQYPDNEQSKVQFHRRVNSNTATSSRASSAAT